MKEVKKKKSTGKNKKAASKKRRTPINRNLKKNEVVKHLLGKKKAGGRPVSGQHNGALHGDTHVNKNSPNVHNNYNDSGKHTDNHLNTHTDQHGDRQRD
jgi:hypothetical protein